MLVVAVQGKPPWRASLLVFINFLSVGAYRYFVRQEKSQASG